MAETKKSKKLDETFWVKRIDDLVTSVSIRRNQWEGEAWINMEFLEGNFEVYWNKVRKQLEILEVKAGESRLAVNKVRSVKRGVKNMITRNEPRWNVKSSRTIKASDKEIKAGSALLHTLYEEEDLQVMQKDVVDHSLLKTWAIVGVFFDEEKNDIDIVTYNPMEVFPDYSAGNNLKKWGFIILTDRRMIKSVKESPLYNDKKNPYRKNLDFLQPEDKRAESLYLNRYMLEREPMGSYQDNDLDTAILKQGLFVNKDTGKIDLYTTMNGKFLRYEELPFSNLDEIFELYFAERNGKFLYHRAWMTDLIPLNRALNRNLSNAESYDDLFVKGRWLNRKNNKISTLTNINGQIITYEGQAPVKDPMQPYPDSSYKHGSIVERHLEDLGGVHADTLGRMSGSAKSGVAIAQLQAGDIQNIAEPTANMKVFMGNLAKKIFNVGSKYYDKVKNVYHLDEITGESEEIKIMGVEPLNEKFGKKKNAPKEIVALKPFTNIRAEIIPGSAFSDLQARQDVLELRQAQVKVPDSVILDAYNFGNTKDLIDKWHEEQEQKEEQAHPDIKIAEGENQKLLKGQPIVVRLDEDHDVHLPIHAAALKALGPNSRLSAVLMDHIRQHEANKEAPKQPAGRPAAAPPGAGPALPQAAGPVPGAARLFGGRPVPAERPAGLPAVAPTT